MFFLVERFDTLHFLYFEEVLRIIFIGLTSLYFMAKVTYKLHLYKFYEMFSPLLHAPMVPLWATFQ